MSKELVQKIKDALPCNCGEIYKSRGLSAPDCPQCNYFEDIEELVQEYAGKGMKWVKASDRLPKKVIKSIVFKHKGNLHVGAFTPQCGFPEFYSRLSQKVYTNPEYLEWLDEGGNHE